MKFKVEPDEYNTKVKKASSISIKKAILALAGPLTNFIISTILILVGKFNMNLHLQCG